MNYKDCVIKTAELLKMPSLTKRVEQKRTELLMRSSYEVSKLKIIFPCFCNHIWGFMDLYIMGQLLNAQIVLSDPYTAWNAFFDEKKEKIQNARLLGLIHIKIGEKIIVEIKEDNCIRFKDISVYDFEKKIKDQKMHLFGPVFETNDILENLTSLATSCKIPLLSGPPVELEKSCIVNDCLSKNHEGLTAYLRRSYDEIKHAIETDYDIDALYGGFEIKDFINIFPNATLQIRMDAKARVRNNTYPVIVVNVVKNFLLVPKFCIGFIKVGNLIFNLWLCIPDKSMDKNEFFEAINNLKIAFNNEGFWQKIIVESVTANSNSNSNDDIDIIKITACNADLNASEAHELLKEVFSLQNYWSSKESGFFYVECIGCKKEIYGNDMATLLTTLSETITPAYKDCFFVDIGMNITQRKNTRLARMVIFAPTRQSLQMCSLRNIKSHFCNEMVPRTRESYFGIQDTEFADFYSTVFYKAGIIKADFKCTFAHDILDGYDKNSAIDKLLNDSCGLENDVTVGFRKISANLKKIKKSIKSYRCGFTIASKSLVEFEEFSTRLMEKFTYNIVDNELLVKNIEKNIFEIIRYFNMYTCKANNFYLYAVIEVLFIDTFLRGNDHSILYDKKLCEIVDDLRTNNFLFTFDDIFVEKLKDVITLIPDYIKQSFEYISSINNATALKLLFDFELTDNDTKINMFFNEYKDFFCSKYNRKSELFDSQNAIFLQQLTKKSNIRTMKQYLEGLFIMLNKLGTGNLHIILRNIDDKDAFLNDLEKFLAEKNISFVYRHNAKNTTKKPFLQIGNSKRPFNREACLASVRKWASENKRYYPSHYVASHIKINSFIGYAHYIKQSNKKFENDDKYLIYSQMIENDVRCGLTGIRTVNNIRDSLRMLTRSTASTQRECKDYYNIGMSTDLNQSTLKDTLRRFADSMNTPLKIDISTLRNLHQLLCRANNTPDIDLTSTEYRQDLAKMNITVTGNIKQIIESSSSEEITPISTIADVIQIENNTMNENSLQRTTNNAFDFTQLLSDGFHSVHSQELLQDAIEFIQNNAVEIKNEVSKDIKEIGVTKDVKENDTVKDEVIVDLPKDDALVAVINNSTISASDKKEILDICKSMVDELRREIITSNVKIEEEHNNDGIRELCKKILKLRNINNEQFVDELTELVVAFLESKY